MGNRAANRIRTAGIIVILLLVVLSFCGCRARITNTADADRVIEDFDGSLQQHYDDQRTELKMEPVKAPPAPVEPEEVREPEEEEPEPQQAETLRNPSQSKPSSETPRTKHDGTSGTGGKNGKGPGGNGKGTKDDGSGSAKEDPEEPEEEVKTVTVRFNPRGGECGTEKLELQVGKPYGELPAASRAGYSFEGWYTAKDGGIQATPETPVTIDSNHYLYARWNSTSAPEYTVFFDGNGGRVAQKDRKRTLHQGDAYGTLPTPIQDGIVFDGWFTDPEGGSQVTATDVFAEEADETLFAHWSFEPVAYWTYRIRSIRESMYGCQIITCYIEYPTDHETASKCSLLSACNAENAAMNRGSNTTVTDDWVEGRNPKVIIKLINRAGDAGSALAAMQERFPDRRVIAVPKAAVSGSEKEQLFYALYLGITLYPDWFGEIDLDQAGQDLGVSGSIYE